MRQGKFGAMRTRYCLLAAGVLLTGCAPAMPGPVMPLALQPATPAQVSGWVAATRPTERQLVRFGWQFQNVRDGTVGGKGSAQIAIPDSLRFDFRGPLGFGRGAAVVIADSSRWAQPEDQVKKLVPNYPLLWAMFGIARLPARGATLSAAENEQLTAWRYVDGADTIDYVRTKTIPMQLMAEVREAGKRVGRVVTSYDNNGQLQKARLDVPSGPARLTLKFTLVSTPKPFDPEIWHAPVDN